MGTWTYWRKCRKLISTCRFWMHVEWVGGLRDYQKVHGKRWADANRQKTRLACTLWRENNPAYQKKWYQDHKEQKKEKQRQWNLNHREFFSERMAQRRGVLKTEVYLNSRFEGLVLHHMGWINGKMTSAYIPETLHKSVPHSLTKDRNMEKINSASLKWLTMGGMVK